jgi:hypothetical protein
LTNNPNGVPAIVYSWNPERQDKISVRPVSTENSTTNATLVDGRPDILQVLKSLPSLLDRKNREGMDYISDEITTGPDGGVFILTAEMKALGHTVRTAADPDADFSQPDISSSNSSTLYLDTSSIDQTMAVQFFSANESWTGGRSGPHQQRYDQVPDILQASQGSVESSQLMSDPLSNWRLSTNISQLTHSKREASICSKESPCKDESCCSKDGKCGYKKGHCSIELGCQANCNATAMCGIDSSDHATPCGLKLCCSYYGWCGTEDVHCLDPEPQFGKTPCQEGFGSCRRTPSPVCDGQSASNGRKVGYYQSWNVRDRKCDKVFPRDINTRGMTHLFFAFVFFDPETFEVKPMDPGDVLLMGQFTALKRDGLQTWVAVGGTFLKQCNWQMNQ